MKLQTTKMTPKGRRLNVALDKAMTARQRADVKVLVAQSTLKKPCATKASCVEAWVHAAKACDAYRGTHKGKQI
jgi:hypothetical protein